MDQTQPPVDDQADGVYWRHVGVFQCNSGTLKVVLASDGSGSVLAGAVRLVQEPSAPANGLAINGLTFDANGLPAVTYTITGTPGLDCTLFSIGIYESSDGLHTDSIVGEIDVSGEDDLAGNDDLSPGTHTLECTDGLSGLDGADFLIAKLDCYNEVVAISRNNLVSAPLTGMFEQNDGTLFVLGSATWIADDYVTVTQDPTTGDVTVSLANESTSETFSGVTSVIISTPGGGNSIDVDPSVTVPVSVYGGAGGSITGQVANWPDVSIEADLPAVAESGGQTGEFTFSADDTSNGPVTAYFQIDYSSTAYLGYSYTISGATATGYDTYAVTIPADTGEATVDVTPIDTGAVSGSETLVLDVIAGSGYNVQTDSSTATVTILNNDLPTVSIVADAPNATGLGAPGEFTVSRNLATNEPLLVNYSVSGSATNGHGYQTIPGNVVIPAGSTTATVPIYPLYVDATSTSVVLTLAAGSGYVIPNPAPSDTVTIDDGSDPQAPAASEFYIGDGGTFAVPAGATTLYLGFHDDYDWDDNPGSVSAILSWNVGGESDYSVTGAACLEFAFAPSGIGPHGENVDADRPYAVSVPAGATSVTISASGTWDYESPGPGYGPDGDPGYSGQTNSEYYAADLHSENISPVSCNFSSLVGMWTPVSAPTPTLAVGDTVAVAGDTETFTVTLSQKVGYTVTVPYSTADGTAAAGTDYTTTSGTLTFSPGEIFQTVTVPTKLDDTATSDLNFTVVLGSPTVGSGGGTVNVESPGTATIELVTGTLTIYNPDGTPSVDGNVAGGESAPMTVRLTSPAAVDGTFTLSYDTDYFKVTTDAAGDDVVTPGVTPITPSTGGTRFYVWGVAPTSDPAGSQINLDYGDPIIIGHAQARVIWKTAGLNVTQALMNGRKELVRQWAALSKVQQAELAARLITYPNAANAWDIWTLKFLPNLRVPPLPVERNPQGQTICTPGAGIDPASTGENGIPQYVVTVEDGLGHTEEYPTDAVNYYLYGCIMRLVYYSWTRIESAAASDPSLFEVNSLTRMWLTSFWNQPPPQSKFDWDSTKGLVTVYRGNPITWPSRDGSGVKLPVAFAEAGWYGGRSYINGLGLGGWLSNTTAYTGEMEYILGSSVAENSSRDKPKSPILDFYA